jgi:C1A family cysteine protease
VLPIVLLVSTNDCFRIYYTYFLLGAYEYLTKKSNGRDTYVSRLFIYYNARIKDNEVVDSGCSMTDAIEALEKFGTCLESIWPYDISRVNTRPNDEAYEQAENHKINKALQINIDLIEMKSCLAQGFPFAFGLKLYSSFDKAAQAGVVPIPYVWEQGRQSNGRFLYHFRSNRIIYNFFEIIVMLC